MKCAESALKTRTVSWMVVPSMVLEPAGDEAADKAGGEVVVAADMVVDCE
jgi:hypothetical protein